MSVNMLRTSQIITYLRDPIDFQRSSSTLIFVDKETASLKRINIMDTTEKSTGTDEIIFFS